MLYESDFFPAIRAVHYYCIEMCIDFNLCSLVIVSAAASVVTIIRIHVNHCKRFDAENAEPGSTSRVWHRI